MNIRLATDKDIDTILETFECAKKYMRANGNSRQWNGSYPDRGLMLSEIAAGHCHVVETGEGLLAGTFCLILGPDPTYAKIDGPGWVNAGPYGTVHRLASNGIAHGIGKACIDYCLNVIPNLRADTHEDNKTMQHLLESNGFVRCGIIHIADGSPRIAYQKVK